MDPAGYCTFLLSSGLIYFNVTVIDKKVLLKWKTANPLPIQDFEVEKRTGTNNWTSLLTVGSTDMISEYAATDTHPDQGYNHYRLKITGKNNIVSYSEIRSVYVNLSGAGFEIFPNPATTRITINRKNYSREAQKNAWYRHWVELGLAAVESQLAGHPATGSFCHGEMPTLADCCLVPQVFNARRFDCDLSAMPVVRRIAAHCETLPAFQAAVPQAQADAE